MGTAEGWPVAPAANPKPGPTIALWTIALSAYLNTSASKAWRYQHGIGNGDQAIITLDCPNVETAHEVRKYLTGKFRVPHVSVATPYPDYDDRVTVTLILAETLSDVRMETAYQVINDRWPHLPLAMDIGPLPPSEFAEYIVTQHKIGDSLNPVSFAGWIKNAPAVPDYQFNEPDSHTVNVEPFKDAPHRCADCDATYKAYPDGKNLSPATRAINAEKRNEVFASQWLDGLTIDYQDITDMAAGGETSAVYNRIRTRIAYSGPRALISDTAAAIRFTPECASALNPRGAYLPPNASLAMMVVMATRQQSEVKRWIGISCDGGQWWSHAPDLTDTQSED